jgi:hypothetical protein
MTKKINKDLIHIKDIKIRVSSVGKNRPKQKRIMLPQATPVGNYDIILIPRLSKK